MNVQYYSGSVAEIICDAAIVPVFEGVSLPASAMALDQALEGGVTELLRNRAELGKFGASQTVYVAGSGKKAKMLIILGMGKEEALTPERLRSIGGSAIRAAKKAGAKTACAPIPTAGAAADVCAQAFIEGLFLGDYQFNEYKTSGEKASVETIHLTSAEADAAEAVQKAITRAKAIADGVNLSRDLVNHPANVMTPGRMAAHAQQLAADYGMELTVLERSDMERLGMNTFLAVAQGSQESPKMIILKYTGNPGCPETSAFVGKGITFDSGGISLKPSEGMGAMKDDMGGAAAVLGALKAIAELKLPVNILGVMPCTENMPSGTAFRPGDVIKSMNGKTIEIISTDAEGRLILADAITYAKQLGAARMVDLATLTGACVVALGSVTSGVVTNNEEWCQSLLKAAKTSGEKMWQLPAFDEYREQIKSDIADMKNSGGRGAGTITAALFLSEFAEDTPWVHIDIAGTVVSDKENGYISKGATGAGVRTLVQLAADLA